MRVLLRCDATAAGGVGHLVRSVALAEEVLARGGDVVLAGAVEVPLAGRLVAALAEGSDAPCGPDGRVEVRPAPADAAGLARLAQDVGADLVHVDDYAVGDVGDALRRVGVASSSIEDGAFGRRPADVVVDPTLGAAGRPADGSGQVLAGVGYAPVRRVVRRLRDARDVRPGRDGAAELRVLVVLGGTDPFGVTGATVRLCLAAGVPADRLTVVAPFARHDDVRAVAGATGLPGIHLAEPDEGFPALAAAQGLVLTAAGTTVLELACLGVPTGIVAVTENQVVGYRRAVAAGIAVGIGTGADVAAGSPTALAAVARLVADPGVRASVATAGRALVDGLGAVRIVDAWERAIGVVPVVTARTATEADAPRLLAWRNDPGTRTASRSTDPVDAADHGRWLAAVLADPARLLLVAERAGVPVGTVRFDRVAPDLWEVSITLAPEARGRHLAGPVLAAGERAWHASVGRAGLLAHVRPENAASLRLFESAGYRRAAERDEAGVVGLVKP